MRIHPMGDGAVLVEIDTVASVENARRARTFAQRVDAARAAIPGLQRPVAAAASVLVPCDPQVLDVETLIVELRSLLFDGQTIRAANGPAAVERHDIPVRYGGEDGPDLAAVAEEAGLTPQGVIDLHAGTGYEVMFLGFAPGFAYLGEVHPRLVVPRLATPRTRVPAGSVAIANTMTAVYPQVSPGGWRILGRTDITMFDPAAAPPARLRPGDRVRFVPV